MLGDLSHLHEFDVSSPLPRLAEDITLAVVDEVRLVGVVGRNSAIQGARGQQWQPEAVGIKRRNPGGSSGSPGNSLLWRAARERNDRIRDAIVDAVENAADRAGVINHAVRLAALDDGQARNRPSIPHLALH